MNLINPYPEIFINADFGYNTGYGSNTGVVGNYLFGRTIPLSPIIRIILMITVCNLTGTVSTERL
jgi:hypothetical protein